MAMYETYQTVKVGDEYSAQIDLPSEDGHYLGLFLFQYGQRKLETSTKLILEENMITWFSWNLISIDCRIEKTSTDLFLHWYDTLGVTSTAQALSGSVLWIKADEETDSLQSLLFQKLNELEIIRKRNDVLEKFIDRPNNAGVMESWQEVKSQLRTQN